MITEITPFSECHIDWGHAVHRCRTRQQLLEACKHFGELVTDAQSAVEKMSDTEFEKEWLPGFRMEVQGSISPGKLWLQRYGCIMMPNHIATVGLVATNGKMPFGLAYGLLKEHNKIKCSIPFVEPPKEKFEA